LLASQNGVIWFVGACLLCFALVGWLVGWLTSLSVRSFDLNSSVNCSDHTTGLLFNYVITEILDNHQT